MYTILDGLKAGLDLQKELVNNLNKAHVAKLTQFVNNVFCLPTEAMICRNVDLSEGLHHDFEIRFDLGFWNDAEQRVDFGSDVTFEYTIQFGLRINHGCMGYFNKENIYQFKRIKLLNHVVTCIGGIEDYFHTYMSDKIDDYKQALADYYKLLAEVHTEENKIKAKQRTSFENRLTVGTQLKYKETVNTGVKLFYSFVNREKDVWYITKITPKKYYITGPNNESKTFDKNRVIDEFMLDRLEIYG